MILDTLDNSSNYTYIHPGLEQFFKAFKKYNSSNYPLGIEHLDGEDAFIIFKQYETSPAEGALMEAHNQFWDIMYMVEGEETVYVKPRSKLNHIVKEYDVNDEALLAKLDSDCTPVLLTAGQFLILFPEDAHCPARETSSIIQVKKIIGKLRINPISK